MSSVLQTVQFNLSLHGVLKVLSPSQHSSRNKPRKVEEAGNCWMAHPLHRRRDAAGSVGHADHSLELVNLE